MSNETSHDALEQTLKSLLDGAENLNKGGVENSGTHGSGGPQGGGQGSESDAGPVDSMMIAKMIASGVDVNTAAAFQNFMAKMKGGEDEDEDEDAFKSDAVTRAAGEALVKSFREHLSDNLTPEDNEMVNVTPYLDGLTQTVGERLDGLNKSIVAGQLSQEQVNLRMGKALAQVGKLAKSQEKVITELGRKLGIIEKAPVASPKGVQGTAQPIEKSMTGEAGSAALDLTKSQALSTLSYMNLVKGEREIHGRRTSDIITGLEAGNIFDAQTHSVVRTFLKSLPADERVEALTF